MSHMTPNLSMVTNTNVMYQRHRIQRMAFYVTQILCVCLFILRSAVIGSLPTTNAILLVAPPRVLIHN